MQQTQRALWATLVTLLAVAAVQVVTLRFLQADGVQFFADILARHTFEGWDFARQFAHYITQAPLVFGLRVLQIRNVTALAYLYGVGLYGVAPLCFALCWWVAPTSQRVFVLPIGLCLACFALTTSFFVISESSVASALFFYLLVFLVLRMPHEAPTGAHCAVALAAGLASVRTYEFFAILGPCVLLLLFNHRRLGRPRWSAMARCTLGFLASTALVSTGLSLYFMFYSGRNVGSAHVSELLPHLLQDPTVMGSCLVVAAATLSMARSFKAPILASPIALLAGTLAGLSPLLWPDSLATSGLHYDARLLHLVLPFGLMLATLWMQERKFKPQAAALTLPLTGLLTWCLVWQICAGSIWMRYLARVDNVLLTHHDFVDLAATGLDKDPFMWSWTMPSLSIVRQAMMDGRVSTIILPTRNDPYMPFDPQRPATYPDLRAYGVVYALPPGP